MALATNLSFVTVMDAKVVHKDITNGASYVLTDGGTVALPIQSTGVSEAALETNLEIGSLVDTVTTTGVTITTNSITLASAGGTILLDNPTVDTNDSSVYNWDVTFTTATSGTLVLAPVNMSAVAAIPSYVTTLATLECLTISNITQEGPRKEVRAGREAQPCIRYGKTMRLEMETVIFNSSVLATLGGAVVVAGTSYKAVDVFPGAYGIIGDSYVVNKTTGDKELIWVTFSEYLPDGLFDITMESEGDIGMFNLSGELFPNVDGAYYIITEKTA